MFSPFVALFEATKGIILSISEGVFKNAGI
jgi:hypothetical protein